MGESIISLVDEKDEDATESTVAPARRLPWKRIFLVLLIVLLNAYLRCEAVWEKDYLWHSFCNGGPLCPGCGIWSFTKDRWLEVVWPWK